MTLNRSLMAGLAAVLALACSACASSTHSSSTHAAPSRTRSATSAGLRTSTTTTVSSSSSDSSLPGAGKPTVTIGDKNYTEQFVLGQLYLQALKAQGFSVDIDQNIGPTDVTSQALRTGSLAMYPEYLDVFNSSVAGYRHGFRTRQGAYRAAQRYALGQGLSLLDLTPFSDTDGIAVTVAFAAENHLRSIFDLRRVGATLTMAGPAQFGLTPSTQPGLPVLATAYGVTPVSFDSVPVGAQYAPLNDGTAQAAYVNTTDGQLASGDYRVLSDHRHMFGWGNVVPVVSAKALAEEGPAFADTIERVDSHLTTQVMRQLNYAVDIAKQSPAAVAKQFLQTHGLLTPEPA